VAGDLVYAQGEDDVRYVHGLRTTDSKAYASIQTNIVYTVELDGPARYPAPSGVAEVPRNASDLRQLSPDR
jgi:folate-binding Fe-S cluster repair protein YgfZ